MKKAFLVEFASPSEIKRTPNLETYLHTLFKATNYSIKVLAYTSSGDGVSSSAVYCSTEEDRKCPKPFSTTRFRNLLKSYDSHYKNEQYLIRLLQ